MRIILSILIGGAIAFGLFVLMAKLIENSNRPSDEIPEAPVIDIVMQEPDEETQTRSRVPPPPPPPPQQPPKVQPQEPDDAEPDDTGFSLAVPQIDTGVNVNIGGVGAMRQDGDATPIVRIEPKYPPQAARDGKEGWVRLSFTINEQGGVDDIKVIEAEPRRIFDREARRALAKWKYKPKIEGGKAVKQLNQFVQLDFKLEQ